MLINVKKFGAVLSVIALLVSLLAVSCSKEGAEKKTKIKGKTDLTILFTSDLHGNVRSCGCAVEDMGGLGRMATFVKETRKEVSNLLFLGCGDDFSLDLSFTKDRANLIMECYEEMGLDVFTTGEAEYIFGLDYLINTADVSSFVFMVSNLVNSKDGTRIFEPGYIVKEYDSGFKVGITGVLDDSVRFPDYIDNSEFKLTPVVETMDSVAARMNTEVDFMILLSHMGLENTRSFLELVPSFDVAIVGHGSPKIEKIEKVGETILLGVGGKGKYLGKLDLEISEKGEIEYEAFKLVPLKTRIPFDNGIKMIFNSHGVALNDKEEEKRKYK